MPIIYYVNDPIKYLMKKQKYLISKKMNETPEFYHNYKTLAVNFFN